MVIEDTRRGEVFGVCRLGDIPEGQVFTGRTPLGVKGTFLRTYSEVVCLDDPSETWDRPGTAFGNYVPRDAKVVLL